jgi:thioredoxin-like negative regulator of GroEL
VLKNPDDVVEAFKEIGKQLKGKNLSEALDSLLGGNDGDDGRKKPKARDRLRQFLKP